MHVSNNVHLSILCCSVVNRFIATGSIYGINNLGTSAGAIKSSVWAPISPWDAMLARYMLWPCVCLSVRLSVTGRWYVKTAKQASRKHRCTIVIKIVVNYNGVIPNRRR